jgi:glycine/serine hydroxymethyltransferase
MRETEMEQIGGLMARVLAAPGEDRVIRMVKTEVEQLCRRFPLYDTQLLNR